MSQEEARFRDWYKKRAEAWGLDPDPDNPEHYYDYRAAYRTGSEPDATGHWPSKFKREGHPQLVIGGVDTRTGDKIDGVEEMVRQHIRRRQLREDPDYSGYDENMQDLEEEAKGLSLPLKLAPVLANLADAYTTYEALRRGGREGNPLMADITKKPLAHAGLKAGVGVASSLISDRIARTHPTYGKILAVLATAIPGALAINNTIQAGKQDRINRNREGR